jgi:ABC-type transport system involved in cytochrome c biogenesis permease subunit
MERAGFNGRIAERSCVRRVLPDEEAAMWNVPIAAIPGPWPTLSALTPWLAGAAAAVVLIGLALVVFLAAARNELGERRVGTRLRRLHGVRAA